jgi:hypothetical protein
VNGDDHPSAAQRSRRPFLLLVAAFGAAMLLIVGCGGPPKPPEGVDASLARTSLERVLNAWKEKSKPDALRQDSAAPIHAADEDWIMGYELVRYEISADAPQPIGSASLRYEVQLELKSPQGQRVDRKAKYLVSTSPSVSVVRAESN